MKALCATMLSAVAFTSLCARAQDDTLDAGVFAKWLASDSPKCVLVSEIGSVSHLTKLNDDQFQFARALYIAMPPVSRALPPGDSAVIARAGDKAMIALVEGVQSCARFLAPDFIQTMLGQVGKGENQLIGSRN
jgi:hypothetical protein